MATIQIKFDFSRGGQTRSEYDDIDVSDSLMSDVDDRKDEFLSDFNDDLDEDIDEWEFDDWSVETFDDDFADPGEFTDLDEYGAYVELCEEHGEGYRLRYDDIGEHNFDDEYRGCWRSAEEFVRGECESCYEIPDFLQFYVDWEKMANDWMMDYSSYEGSEGLHIFDDR